MKTRLAANDADESKEFFTRAVLVVSKDENLTKGHRRYLESRIIALIRSAGRAMLVNSTEPPFKGVPEAEIADMERTLDEIEILLAVLGFDVLQPATGEAPVLRSSVGGAPTFIADIKKAKGRAAKRGGEFVVLAGSTALRHESDAIPQSVKDSRKALLEAGVFAPDSDPELCRFTQDASAAIAGRADSGRQTWRVEGDGKSYAAWRESLTGQGGTA